MASVRKRGGKWRAEVRLRGVYESRTFRKKATALFWAQELEENILAGTTTHETHLLLDALKRYELEVAPRLKGARQEALRLRAIQRREIALNPLNLLAPAHVAKYRDSRLKSVSSASVNRELNIISAVINTARIEWGWIDNNPVSGIRRPKNPAPRNRRISDGEVKAICAEIRNQDLHDIFLLGLETAMRLGEMCSIKQADIHGRWVTLHNTKNNDTRHVPLSSRARDLIREFDITPANASKLFKMAVDRAGIDDLRFHDSRREATFRLAKIIKNPMDLAKITGHKDLKILLNVYYSPSPSDLALLLE